MTSDNPSASGSPEDDIWLSVTKKVLADGRTVTVAVMNPKAVPEGPRWTLDTIEDYVRISYYFVRQRAPADISPAEQQLAMRRLQEFREEDPAYLASLLVPAVLTKNFLLLGDEIPEPSHPAVHAVLEKFNDAFFERLEEAGRIRLGPVGRCLLTNIAYGWIALQMRGPPRKARHRGRGAPRKWEQDVLIALLSFVYEESGGKRTLSWGADSETVAGPHADFLRILWEVLPSTLTASATSETFARRARKEHFFNRRFKDDIEHSQWLREQEEKKKEKTKKRRSKRKLAPGA